MENIKVDLHVNYALKIEQPKNVMGLSTAVAIGDLHTASLDLGFKYKFPILTNAQDEVRNVEIYNHTVEMVHLWR